MAPIKILQNAYEAEILMKCEVFHFVIVLQLNNVESYCK